MTDTASPGESTQVGSTAYPPSGTAGIAIVPPRPGDSTGVQTGIILNTDDIDAAHAEMQASGIDVDADVALVGAPAAIRIGAVELVGSWSSRTNEALT